jgi:hypothetical protein
VVIHGNFAPRYYTTNAITKDSQTDDPELLIPGTNFKTTPMMKQYFSLKQKHEGFGR